MPSGRPDWFGTIVAAGQYDTQMIAIGVDVSGNIIAVMKGDYSDVLKTIAVDANGIMKANLSVQDLDFLTVRPAYGEAVEAHGTEAISASSTETLKTVTGRGVVIGGWFSFGIGQTHKSIECGIKTEGTVVQQEAASVLNGRKHYTPGCQPLYLSLYDDIGFDYCVGISKGLTFETSFDMFVKNPYAFETTVIWFLFYALVP